MPLSSRLRDTTKIKLRIPQARILQALMPDNPNSHWIDWPLLNRALLGVRAGYTPISGSITRALKGVRAGSSSGPPQLGLLDLGLVKEIDLDIEGVRELNYHITQAGIEAYKSFTAKKSLPPVRDASICINGRYKKEDFNE